MRPLHQTTLSDCLISSTSVRWTSATRPTTNETDNLTAANEVSVLDDFYLSDEFKNYVAQIVCQYPGGFKSEDWSSKTAMPSPPKRTEGS